tara:strand:+ start:118 stop:663 length:546 start_codon:yes stop_codon:yes gene_type:complete
MTSPSAAAPFPVNPIIPADEVAREAASAFRYDGRPGQMTNETTTAPALHRCDSPYHGGVEEESGLAYDCYHCGNTGQCSCAFSCEDCRDAGYIDQEVYWEEDGTTTFRRVDCTHDGTVRFRVALMDPEDYARCEHCGLAVDGPGFEQADGEMWGPCCDRYDEDAAQDAVAYEASDREEAAR